MPLYSITKWFGGMSNDDDVGVPGAVADAINVDTSQSKGVKLSRSFGFTRPNSLFTSAEGKPIALIQYQSAVNRLIASRNGRLINFTNLITDITGKVNSISNMLTLTSGNIDVGVIAGNLGSVAKLYRWNLSNSLDVGIGTGGANIVDSGVIFPNDINGGQTGFREKCPFLVKGPKIYIAGGNGRAHNIYSVDISNFTTWSVDADFLALDRGFEVRYMSNIGDQIVIYATNGDHGKQYFWDGISTEVDRYIDWYDRPLLGGASINNIDYVLTGTNRKRELYQVQGYQATKLFETDVYVNNQSYDKFFFDTENGGSNLIETVGDTLILPGDGWIYKFGNNKIGFPKNISRDRIFGLVNGLSYNDTYGDQLILLHQASSFDGTFRYYISQTNLRQPNDSGSLFPDNTFGIIKGLKYDGGSYALKKKAIKYKLGYSLDQLTGTTFFDNGVVISARIDDGYEYTDFYTYVYNNGNYTTKPSIGDVYTIEGKNFVVYDITDRFIINSSGDLVELKNAGIIVHTKCTDKRYSLIKRGISTGVLTKVSGDGDTNIRFYYADEGFQVLSKVKAINPSDFNKKQHTLMLDKDFHRIQFKFDLYTNTSLITPIIEDFYLQYEIIQNDLGK